MAKLKVFIAFFVSSRDVSSGENEIYESPSPRLFEFSYMIRICIFSSYNIFHLFCQ